MSPDSDWDALPEQLQLALAQEAMRRAADTIAGQAETLAGEIEDGSLADRGGPDALRLLAAVVRLAARDKLVPCGSA
ncbi:MAG: hypothetical protein M0Z28_26270 [Rhodospirillales bacterium]|nr:hypothetical protein [Rhodospirillales bacterium]